MIDGIICGIVGGLIAGGGRERVVEKYIQAPRGNELIEYHEWLEKRRNDEIEDDDRRIRGIYKDRCTRRGQRVQEIEVKTEKIQNPASWSTSVRITAECGCRAEKTQFEVDEAELVFLENGKKKFRDRVDSEIRTLLEKIRGKVSYDEIRRKFMKEKLKSREYKEKYYGRA